ncbi:MAG: hypothetical protein KBS41_03050, partial [Oscillospiraceae bacterium]|nr:hypothetical protein [Candidatus Equicaccousia limihippi]
MKRLLGILLCVIFLTGTVSFSAAAFDDREHGVSFATPKEFFELTSQNSHDNQDLLDLIGYTEKSFDTYLEKSGIIYFALNQDNSKQIIIRCKESALSQNLDDLSDLGEEGIDSFAKKILPKGCKDYGVIKIGDTAYLQMTTNSTDSGGKFYTVQYFTVKNKNLYSIAFNYGGGKSEETESTTEEYMEGLTIDSSAPETYNDKHIFFIILVIIIIA